MCRRESDEFQRAAWTREREVGHFNLESPWHVRRLLRERVRSSSLGVLKQTPKGLLVVLEKRFVVPVVGGCAKLEISLILDSQSFCLCFLQQVSCF